MTRGLKPKAIESPSARKLDLLAPATSAAWNLHRRLPDSLERLARGRAASNRVKGHKPPRLLRFVTNSPLTSDCDSVGVMPVSTLVHPTRMVVRLQKACPTRCAPIGVDGRVSEGLHHAKNEVELAWLHVGEGVFILPAYPAMGHRLKEKRATLGS